MHAEIEPISGVMRVFADGGSYGDPYEWVATIRWLDRKTIEIVGMNTTPKPSHWRAVRACCREWGADEFVFYRVKDGVKKLHRIEVR